MFVWHSRELNNVFGDGNMNFDKFKEEHHCNKFVPTMDSSHFLWKLVESEMLPQVLAASPFPKAIIFQRTL